jgi:hypothetical protein
MHQEEAHALQSPDLSYRFLMVSLRLPCYTLVIPFRSPLASPNVALCPMRYLAISWCFFVEKTLDDREPEPRHVPIVLTDAVLARAEQLGKVFSNLYLFRARDLKLCGPTCAVCHASCLLQIVTKLLDSMLQGA